MTDDHQVDRDDDDDSRSYGITLQVYTWGSNCQGQLGVGDTTKRDQPQHVRLPANAARVEQAIAGANHCVLRLANGEIITFGAHRSGQLGRRPATMTTTADDRHWHCRPTVVPGWGPNCQLSATWIGVCGDRTFVQASRGTINTPSDSASQIFAESSSAFFASSTRRLSDRGKSRLYRDHSIFVVVNVNETRYERRRRSNVVALRNHQTTTRPRRRPKISMLRNDEQSAARVGVRSILRLCFVVVRCR